MFPQSWDLRKSVVQKPLIHICREVWTLPDFPLPFGLFLDYIILCGISVGDFIQNNGCISVSHSFTASCDRIWKDLRRELLPEDCGWSSEGLPKLKAYISKQLRRIMVQKCHEDQWNITGSRIPSAASSCASCESPSVVLRQWTRCGGQGELYDVVSAVEKDRLDAFQFNLISTSYQIFWRRISR